MLRTALLLAVAPTAFVPAIAADPLAKPSIPPYQAPPFDRIAVTDYRPAIEQGIAARLAEVRAFADDPAPPTFDNTIVAMERPGQRCAARHSTSI